MDNSILSAIIGFIGAIIGALIGGKYTERVSKSNIEAQNKALDENKLQQSIKEKEFCISSSKIIYLDLLTALHEGFRFLKTKKSPALLPLNNEYSKALVLISNNFRAEELILLNKLFGIIEKIRYDILNTNYAANKFTNIEHDYTLLEEEVFKEKYSEILSYDVIMITKDYLITQLSKNYKIIFQKLNELEQIN